MSLLISLPVWPVLGVVTIIRAAYQGPLAGRHHRAKCSLRGCDDVFWGQWSGQRRTATILHEPAGTVNGSRCDELCPFSFQASLFNPSQFFLHSFTALPFQYYPALRCP